MHVRTVGPVRIEADSPALADNCATAVARTLPRFQVPHTRPKTLVVRVGAPGMLDGTADEDEAIVDVDPACARIDTPLMKELTAVLTHELHHLYIPPLEREHLPALLEEGLVDRRMLELVPEVRAQRRAEHAMRLLASLGSSWSLKMVPGELRIRRSIEMVSVPGLPPLEEAFAPNQYNFGSLPAAQSQLLTALGWFLIERAGEPAVLALVQRAASEGVAKVPVEWMLEASGLADRPPRDWLPLFGLLIGEAEERALAEGETILHRKLAPK